MKMAGMKNMLVVEQRYRAVIDGQSTDTAGIVNRLSVVFAVTDYFRAHGILARVVIGLTMTRLSFTPGREHRHDVGSCHQPRPDHVDAHS